jgi:hypothetical protein
MLEEANSIILGLCVGSVALMLTQVLIAISNFALKRTGKIAW